MVLSQFRQNSGELQQLGLSLFLPAIQTLTLSHSRYYSPQVSAKVAVTPVVRVAQV
jgi:hypothetical protein